MTMVFADTFYFFALLNRNESRHAQAQRFASSFQGYVVTTQWVLTELADGLARSPRRAAFSVLHQELLADSRIRIEPCSDALFSTGLKLYIERPDKDWSLTDCISFVVMQREGIVEALTGDHHFEQAGFTALLK